MAYEVHLILDNPLSLDEWGRLGTEDGWSLVKRITRTVAGAPVALECDEGYAICNLNGDEVIFSLNSAHDTITVARPTAEIIALLLDLSDRFPGIVEGDEGERYVAP